MRILFAGATGSVTSSPYLVEVGGSAVLVNRGLVNGLQTLRVCNWAPLPFDLARIEAVQDAVINIGEQGDPS